MSKKKTKKSSENDLKSFKLNYLQFKVKVFLILKILTCNFYMESKFSLVKKLICPGIVGFTVISTTSKVPYSLMNTEIFTKTSNVLMIFGLSQIFSKVTAVSVYGKKIENLVSWFGEIEKEELWSILEVSAGNRLQRTLFYAKMAIMSTATLFFVTITLMASFYFMSDSLLFWTPFKSRNFEFFIQFFFLYLLIIFLIVVESLLLILGFFFVCIINVFLDAVRKLDDEACVRTSGGIMRKFYSQHLEILEKLCDLQEVFRGIQTCQVASNLLIIVGTLYMMQIYPHGFVNHIIFLNIVAQFFTICLFGEFIHSKTEQIFTALYLTRWYEMKKDDQMILLMMMKKTQKPVSLKIAGMYEINMQ
uniref:Odorant receptor n=1 Tax=Lutzomyia longipalpis TaxID=7200 RepID=A0A3F2ZDG1_LUTLO